VGKENQKNKEEEKEREPAHSGRRKKTSDTNRRTATNPQHQYIREGWREKKRRLSNELLLPRLLLHMMNCGREKGEKRQYRSRVSGEQIDKRRRGPDNKVPIRKPLGGREPTTGGEYVYWPPWRVGRLQTRETGDTVLPINQERRPRVTLPRKTRTWPHFSNDRPQG